MSIWLITFNNDIEQQKVVKYSITAFRICAKYLKKVYPNTPIPIDQLQKSFLSNSDDFGYGLTCWVKRLETE